MMMKSVIVSIPAMKTSIKTLSLYTTYSTVPAGVVQLGRRDSAYKGVPPSPPLTLYPHADLAFIIHHTLTKLSAGKKNDTTKPIHSWFGFWHHLTNGKCICFRACAAFFFFFFFFLVWLNIISNSLEAPVNTEESFLCLMVYGGSNDFCSI